MSDIIRCTFNINNDNVVGKQILMTPCATEVIVNDPSLYNVAVEKCRLPNVSKFRPIDNNVNGYSVSLWYDLKDNAIPGINYGFNHFKIEGAIYSVEEFISKINDIIHVKMIPLDAGRFYLTVINGSPILTFKSGVDLISRIIDIYIDTKIINLFNFNYDLNDSITQSGRELVRLIAFTNTIAQEQNSFSYDLFFKIESICIHSNLPTSEHYIQDKVKNTLTDSDLLMEIYYNSTQFIGNNNIFYLPDMKVWSSMHSSQSLSNIRIWFTYKYTDGTEIAAFLEQNQAARLTLLFEKKKLDK